MFYSVVGPMGSTFKINELEVNVYVRNGDKTETTVLTCKPMEIRQRRRKHDEIINEAEITTNNDRYVLTSITGQVNWIAKMAKENGGEVVLKLQLYKGDDSHEPDSELTLAKIKPVANTSDASMLPQTTTAGMSVTNCF